jgi:hypothetical protein
MLVKLITAVVLAGCVGGWCWAQSPEEEPRFTATGQLLRTLKSAPALSGDGQVVTHILEGAVAAVGGSATPDADTVSLSLRSVLAKHDKPISVKQRLVGHIDVDPGVEASLILQGGGKTTVVALPKEGRGDFDITIPGTVGEGQDYLANIWIALQRGGRDRKVSGVLQLDSLEISIARPATRGRKSVEPVMDEMVETAGASEAESTAAGARRVASRRKTAEMETEEPPSSTEKRAPRTRGSRSDGL